MVRGRSRPTFASMLESLTTALADRYTIGRELGAGGMGTVYLARELKHDREVALRYCGPKSPRISAWCASSMK